VSVAAGQPSRYRRHYIFTTLDEAGRIRLKLLTPLGALSGRIVEALSWWQATAWAC